MQKKDMSRSKSEVAKNTRDMIRMRCQVYKDKKSGLRYIRMTQIGMIIIMVSTVTDAYMGNFRWWQSLSLILSTFLLMNIHFNSMTEKYGLSKLASGLATDIIINLAMQIDEYARRQLVIGLEKNGSGLGITVGFDDNEIPNAKIAMRIVQKIREKEGTWEVVNGYLPRIRPADTSYEFTAEDIADIITAMRQNPQLIEVYIILLKLIEATLEKEKEQGKWLKIPQIRKTVDAAT